MSGTGGDSGVLYVVATPLGNQQDISSRAIATLGEVDLIAAEDTRHSARLLEALGIGTPLISFHDFSSEERLAGLIQRLQEGQSLALVSDAGTPCISDPGYELVRAARHNGIPVLPIPGASAAIAALSVSGLPSDRFLFEGFLPARSQARITRLDQLAQEDCTLIFYESPHRIVDCLEDLLTVVGPERELYLGRELTKKFETSRLGRVAEILAWVRADPQQRKGEFVLVLAGRKRADSREEKIHEGLRVLQLLAPELSLKRAARLAADITGAPKNLLYQAALQSASNAEPGQDD
ncbi:MAG: 16S rRNA (cytidine(1402)-2'-O)-methyltransferase [Gammaproteobacteria bacterium]|nr:16S rRNA (cytidine(1402)-2'-O)-methyltransferase [Pseudomonadales bacterium]MCP5345554.1 16S rRNA (cytidine(1402)-2'-O)-methyltransferase [Pseudomonadales bacterium]